MELFLHGNITDATSYVISTSGKLDLHFIMQNTFVTSQERRKVTLNCEIKLYSTGQVLNGLVWIRVFSATFNNMSVIS
jgi:hypothetical protein